MCQVHGAEVGGGTDKVTREWEAAWVVISMECPGEGSSLFMDLLYKIQKPSIIK